MLFFINRILLALAPPRPQRTPGRGKYVGTFAKNAVGELGVGVQDCKAVGCHKIALDSVRGLLKTEKTSVVKKNLVRSASQH